MLDRYGEAVEADLLREFGVDMLDLWRGTLTVRRVLNLIDRLPRASHVQQAIADDDDLAEMRDADATAPPSMPLTEWTAQTELIAYVADVLGELVAVTVAAHGNGQIKHPPRLPRPLTAHDRLVARRQRAAYEELLDLVRAAGANA